MTVQDISSYCAGAMGGFRVERPPGAVGVTGELIGRAGNDSLDAAAMLDYARSKGGPALRKMTFHERAKMLKALALHMSERKQSLYDISFDTGATQSDSLIDIDGGIGTVFVFASKGRREMPNAHVHP